MGAGKEEEVPVPVLRQALHLHPELPGRHMEERSSVCSVILSSRQTSSGGAGWPWRSGPQGDLWGLIKRASRWAHHPQGRDGDSCPVESEGLFQGMAPRERTLLELALSTKDLSGRLTIAGELKSRCSLDSGTPGPEGVLPVPGNPSTRHHSSPVGPPRFSLWFRLAPRLFCPKGPGCPRLP